MTDFEPVHGGVVRIDLRDYQRLLRARGETEALREKLKNTLEELERKPFGVGHLEDIIERGRTANRVQAEHIAELEAELDVARKERAHLAKLMDLEHPDQLEDAACKLTKEVRRLGEVASAMTKARDTLLGQYETHDACFEEIDELLGEAKVPDGTLDGRPMSRVERIRWLVIEWREERAQLQGMRDGMKQLSDELKDARLESDALGAARLQAERDRCAEVCEERAASKAFNDPRSRFDTVRKEALMAAARAIRALD